MDAAGRAPSFWVLVLTERVGGNSGFKVLLLFREHDDPRKFRQLETCGVGGGGGGERMCSPRFRAVRCNQPLMATLADLDWPLEKLQASGAEQTGPEYWRLGTEGDGAVRES